MAAFALTVLASWGIYALLGLGIVLVYRTSRILNIAGGEIARRASALSERYRAGRSSHEAVGSREDAAAYLLARLPAIP